MIFPVKIKYSLFYLLLFIFASTSLRAQFEGLKFGSDSTLEVISWNIEHFPKEDQTTIDFVSDLMISIDADIFAIQEVTSEDDLVLLVSKMDGWDYAYAYNQYAALAYVYNTDSIKDVNFFEIYTSKSREFPRSPFVMEFTFMAQPFVIINNHLKCCGDNEMDMNDNWDEEKRRFDACILLDEYIETYYDDSKVILTGDLNDVLIDDFDDNVFEIFIQNDLNYLVADMEIAEGDETNWSYPSWPSHIDHIIITNEFFEDYNKPESETITIKPDEYFEEGFNEYDDLVSDHRPVGIKLKTESYVSIDEFYVAMPSIYPNPVNRNAEVWLSDIAMYTEISIYDIKGKLINKINNNKERIHFNTSVLNKGIYLIKFENSHGDTTVSRFIVK
ncbi:MAG: hypothetical protein C0598_08860 [Marinilabiliales bacterium]|nr:MAG: hypothetical protein C0598_08860 [Marinilabiliales bacterium]